MLDVHHTTWPILCGQSLNPAVASVWGSPILMTKAAFTRLRRVCCADEKHVAQQDVACCRQHVACISATTVFPLSSNKLATILLTATSNMLPGNMLLVARQHVVWRKRGFRQTLHSYEIRWTLLQSCQNRQTAIMTKGHPEKGQTKQAFINLAISLF